MRHRHTGRCLCNPARYDLQKKVPCSYLAVLLASHVDQVYHLPLVGWKIGATNEQAQRRLRLVQPFYGPLFDRDIKPSPATLTVGSQLRIRGVECEYVFRFKQTLEPKDADYTTEDILAAVGSVFPAIELCASRFDAPGSPFQTIADQASHGRLVIAPHLAMNLAQWAEVAADFTEYPVTLHRNGEQIASGNGSAVLGNPVTALTWLANTLKDAGWILREGDLVTSGTMTGLEPVQVGDAITADFRGFGKVKAVMQALA